MPTARRPGSTPAVPLKLTNWINADSARRAWTLAHYPGELRAPVAASHADGSRALYLYRERRHNGQPQDQRMRLVLTAAELRALRDLLLALDPLPEPGPCSREDDTP